MARTRQFQNGERKKIKYKMDHNSHPLTSLINIITIIATGLIGHFTYIFWSELFGIILQILSLVMSIGWCIIHYERVRNVVVGWITNKKL